MATCHDSEILSLRNPHRSLKKPRRTELIAIIKLCDADAQERIDERFQIVRRLHGTPEDLKGVTKRIAQGARGLRLPESFLFDLDFSSSFFFASASASAASAASSAS